MFGKKESEEINLPKTPDGRKYRLAIISMFILLGGFGLAGLNPAFAAIYTELITAILGINALYYGGNVGNKWVIGKSGRLSIDPSAINLNNEAKPNGTINKRGDIDPE